MRHHTKDKGDTGLGFVIADLLAQGIQVATLLSEHLPFDCIAISQNNALCRLSVKYRKKINGCVGIQFRSCWNDRHGTHITYHNKGLYDGVAIYCPDSHQCYYIKNEECQRSVSLRIDGTRNGQKENIHMAEEYRNPSRLFSILSH